MPDVEKYNAQTRDWMRSDPFEMGKVDTHT